MLQFKKLIVENLSDLIALEKNCFKNQWTRKQYLEEMKARKNLIIGAYLGLESNSKLVAALTARYEKIIDECWLLKIMTHPSCQGRGVANLLLGQLEKLQGCSKILLEVNANNKSAIALYRKNSYKIIAKRPGYYPSLDLSSKKRENALIMQKLC